MRQPLKQGLVILIIVGATSSTARADWVEDLRKLKQVCDEGLLSTSECSEEKAKILARRQEKEGSTSIKWFCNYDGDEAIPSLLSEDELASFSEEAGASAIVREILDASGLVPNFVVTPADVPNAAAELRGTERYIRYNPVFLAQAKRDARTNWSVYAVMAHEIGHHLNGHTLRPGGSRPPIEIEADDWSGFILNKLGATVEEAQSFWLRNPDAPGSPTHPPARRRLLAIKQGWERAEALKKGTPSSGSASREVRTKPVSTPHVVGSTIVGQCQVQGESVLIGSDNNLYNAVTKLVVGRKTPPTVPGCAFMLTGISGTFFCVNFQFQVFNPVVPYPVGTCRLNP